MSEKQRTLFKYCGKKNDNLEKLRPQRLLLEENKLFESLKYLQSIKIFFFVKNRVLNKD